ncbi:MAG: chorismate-binding protein, partial [Candidatus Dormibacteraceae bacterium]
VEASGEWWFEALWTTDREAELERRYQILQRRLSQPAPELGRVELGHFTAQPSPAEHQAVIAEGIKHIRAGDVFQVNLCLRLEAAMQGDPLALFIPAVERLRPARAAYLALSQENHLLSFSPELFLQRQGREVLAAPIKGTLNGTLSSMELTHSGKDRAENVMIVDLMRNDLGRVCEAGSISVPTLVGLEAHLGVWHLVSQVRGRLKGGVSDAELLRATFPPGSVTGAPKIRAMELIAELESTGREIYTGAIGYISPLTGLELSVAIRSFEISGDRIWLGVGGGVVADSNPKAEFEECRVKAAPLLQAMGGRWQ